MVWYQFEWFYIKIVLVTSRIILKKRQFKDTLVGTNVLWDSQPFLKGLHKTFWGITKKYENINSSEFLF